MLEYSLHSGAFSLAFLDADYIDYQNRRPDYIGEFVETLINWKKVYYTA